MDRLDTCYRGLIAECDENAADEFAESGSERIDDARTIPERFKPSRGAL